MALPTWRPSRSARTARLWPRATATIETYIWSLATRRMVAALNDAASNMPPGGYQDSGGIESLAFCPDGTLAVGDGDGNVYLWDLSTEKPVAALAPPINIMEANPLYYSPADIAGQIEGGNGPIGVTVISGNHGRSWPQELISATAPTCGAAPTRPLR